MTNANKMFRKFQVAAWIIGSFLVAGEPSSAATTDISQEPLLSTTSGSVVLPNLMFMLDDSGSMGWDYMPDPAKNFAGKYGFNSNHCNGVYYDPNTTYAPPVKSDKSSYASSSFTAAWTDGYAATGSVNLSTTGFMGGSGTGSSGYNSLSVPAFYYNYSGTQTTGAQKDFHNTNSVFYKECISTIGSTTAVDGTHPVNTVFTKVVVSATSGPGSTDERTNFANWYSYYSTRMMMMKTGVGNAFKDITSNYRVGFMTMNDNVSPDFVDIAPFAGGCAVGSGTCQKDKWYTKLYAANPGSSTPLREALSHVGQLYAHKFGSITTYKATITVGGSGATTPTSIKIGGTEILNCAYLISIADPSAPASCPSASTSSAAATNIANEINAMITTAYGASVSGSVVTITGIASSTTPIITKDSGAMTFTAAPFASATTTAQLNGATPADPIEYSCQQNFVILSTDGYWNGSTTYNLANSTVGNQDGTETRPMYDGAGLIQKTTTQLTKVTTQKLQSTQVQDQSQTYNLQQQTSRLTQDVGALQSQTSHLQASTSVLQTQTSQLQTRTSTLQTQTSQLQSQTSTLQGTFSQVLMQCNNTAAACGAAPATGIAAGSWTVKTSGTCTVATNVQCAIVSVSGASATTAAVATSCNTAANITTASTPASSPSNTTTAYVSDNNHFMALGLSNGSPDSSRCTSLGGSGAGTAWLCRGSGTSNPVVSSSSVTDSTGKVWYLVSDVSGNTGCTDNNTAFGGSYSSAKGACPDTPASTAYTLNNADTNGKIYSACAYSGWSAAAGASSCTAVSQSGTPSNTTVVTATQCPGTVVTSAFADTTSNCTATTVPDGSGNTTQCRYVAPGTATVNGWSGWANYAATSCTAATQSAGPSYTVHPARECQTIVTSAFVDTTSNCTVSTANASGVSTQCQYATPGTTTPGWSTWADVNSCTTAAQSGASPYTVHPAVRCQYAASGTTTAGWSTWANAASCTALAQSGASPYTVGSATQCQYAWTNAQGTPSCSTPAYVAGNYSNATVYRNCLTAVTTPYANVASCTTSATPDASGYTTQCQYAAGTLANVASCTPIAQSASSPYTVGTAVTCTAGAVTSSIPVANCVAAPATAGNSWTATTCPAPVVTGPTGVATCTAAAAASGNSYTATTCSTVTVGPVSDASCVAASASASNNYTATTCTAAGAGGTSDTLADVAEYYYGGVIGATGAVGAAGAIDLRNNSLGNCTGALGTEVCTDNVPTSTTDKNPRQHMTTFTLGLGARGRMVYSPTYGSMTAACNPATDGDFCAVLKGATASSSVCTWQSAGTACNWPTPSSGAIENIDDLWHAAVNGRGLYFSATDPATLETGLTSALTGIKARLSAASASATSSPNITQTDRSIFSSTYLTGKWTGEVTAQLINTTTGVVETAISWTAQAQLDTLAQTDCASKAATPTCATPDISTSRTIYTFDNGNVMGDYSGNNLKKFVYASLTTAEKTYFDTKCSTTYLSQCDITMPVLDLAAGNLGTNLVNYLRGNQSKEISGSAGSFRVRDHLLGDTVNAKPAYVKLPQYSFTDAGYSAFITAQSARQGVLYMGSNDGMLHAFNSDTGAEMWTYLPKIVMPNLYKLADQYYGTAAASPHQYYVDGSPETMDIYVATAANNMTVGWHTILVGGLGRGGRGFYALDVTVPASPKALWEICDSAQCAINDADMGYSYGNPVITKRSTDNKWVVLLSSGYNNAGNGQGTLFMLDAVTGAVLHKTATGSGSAASPSGLAKLSPWVDSLATNHTTRYVYGGDLNGNVWRFDLGVAGPDIAPTVTQIASLKDASGVAQSVTTRVELGDPLSSTTNSLGGTGTPAIFVATGRYLGLSDLSNTQVQSVYAIKDDLAKTTSTTPSGYVGNPRAPAFGSFVKQYIFNIGTGETSRTTSTDIITTGCGQGCGPQYSVDWTTKQGWYADFAVSDPATTPPSALSPSPSPGERVNIDPLLINSTLIVVTNVPDTNACSIGGTSWLYSFDFRSGRYVNLASDTLHVVGQKLGHALTAGIVLFSLPDGKIKAVVTLSDSEQITKDPTLQGSSPTRQTSWRELTTQ